MSQKDAFLACEGDAYFNRNAKGAVREHHVISALQRLHIKPRRVLEIGCGFGSQLKSLQEVFEAECFGIDPSPQAVSAGLANNLQLSIGTADRLEYDDSSFDFVLFGFCLYLCDPEDHFSIAAEANRVLQNGGILGICDFRSTTPYRNPYSHRSGLYSYKMEYSRMFLWHPSYQLLSRCYCELHEPFTFAPDEAVSVDLLRKDSTNAFPDK